MGSRESHLVRVVEAVVHEPCDQGRLPDCKAKRERRSARRRARPSGSPKHVHWGKTGLQGPQKGGSRLQEADPKLRVYTSALVAHLSDASCHGKGGLPFLIWSASTFGEKRGRGRQQSFSVSLKGKSIPPGSVPDCPAQHWALAIPTSRCVKDKRIPKHCDNCRLNYTSVNSLKGAVIPPTENY